MNSLVTRTISGIVFTAIVVACLLVHPIPFCVLMLAVMCIGLEEFYKMVGASIHRTQRIMAYFTAVILFLSMSAVCYFNSDPKLTAVALLPLIALPVSYLFAKDHSHVEAIGALYAGLLYIALPISLSPYLVFNVGEFDGALLLEFFILIWVSDIGAYCVGTAFGQKPSSKKLAPDISPKKSWWGVAGALASCVIVGMALHFCGFFTFGLVHSIVLSLIICAGGICGDLFESLVKRHFDIKDSGNLIPGHGGILDRFDSSLIAIPLASIYLLLFNLI